MHKFILSSTESQEIYGKEVKQIGDGTCSVVYKTDKSAAVKVFIAEICTQVPEVAILKKLNHSNILKPLCVNLANHEYITKSYDLEWIDEHTRDSYKQDWIYSSYCKYGIKMYMPLADMTLYTFPEEQMKNIAIRKNIYKQLLQAVSYCHANDVWHTDIKPMNILIFSPLNSTNLFEGTVKLADFSASISYARVSNNNTFDIQTLQYRSPEIVLKYRLYDERIDLWSVGVIMWEYMNHTDLSLANMFCCDSSNHLLDVIIKLIGYPTKWLDGVSKLNMDFKKLSKYDSTMKKHNMLSESYDTQESDLISHLLTWPNKRYSACEALAHPYFSDIPTPIEISNTMPVEIDAEMNTNNDWFDRIKIKRKEAILKMHHLMSSDLKYSSRFHSYVLFDLFAAKSRHFSSSNEDQIPAYLFACMIISSQLLEHLLFIDMDDKRNPTDKYTTAKYINHILEVMEFDIIFDTTWSILQKKGDYLKLNIILLNIIIEQLQTIENQSTIHF